MSSKMARSTSPQSSNSGEPEDAASAPAPAKKAAAKKKTAAARAEPIASESESISVPAKKVIAKKAPAKAAKKAAAEVEAKPQAEAEAEPAPKAKKAVAKKAAAPAAKKAPATVAAPESSKATAPKKAKATKAAGPDAIKNPAAPLVPKLRDDQWLAPYLTDLDRRTEKTNAMRARLTGDGAVTLKEFALGHLHYGLHRNADGSWIFREWAPNATGLYLTGEFSNWEERPEFAATRVNEHGDWELQLPVETLTHGMLHRLRMHWDGGSGDRIPAWARRVVQDPVSHLFSAQVWDAPAYVWKHKNPDTSQRPPLIYEAHIGMAQEEGKVGSYTEFKDLILPRIAAAGYNTVQIMGILEHPYYGSFGYHVSSFFAASSRFGTPEEFKALVDAAHGLGLAVVIDLIHSHSVKNELDGLSKFDGSLWQYFHEGPRGDHPAWDSRCFDYSKPPVLHFLLSNCRYWTEEFHLDGFRFDGVTSMLYFDHGLGKVFTSYADYFHPGVDEEALVYLSLANELIHELQPAALTIAEDVSGMPGLVSPSDEGGTGFTHRLAMGVPDLWAKLGSGTRDEDWNVEHIYHELTNRRAEEKVISYVESHDQAIVGGKSFIFRLLESAIYHDMALETTNPHVDRGIALWKMARLLTLVTAPDGYLNFIGNEFGHPEWVDFPRQGNQWSGHYARRQWSLRDNPSLKYHALGDFDAAILKLLGQPGVFASPTRLLDTHVGHQVLVFQRDGFFIAVNFHPWNSLVDYPIHSPAGVWELALDTDEARFAGPARIRPNQRYHARPVNGGHEIMLYLPARSALVLREVPA